MLYLIVFLGAGLGGALRHGVNVASTRLFGFSFPYGTLVVNVVGSFAMGLLAGYFAYRPGIPQHMRLFLTTGILGGFTTFSTYALDLRTLVADDRLVLAVTYLAGTLLAALLAAWLGITAARRVVGG